jgi:N-acetylmuramoyl-L-alanine amidase
MPRIHTVSQGECLASIAVRYQFKDWKTIYNHAQNAEFKRLRPNPNVIYPGDKIYIPDAQVKNYSGNTEQQHKFVVKRQKFLLRVVLKDKRHKILANTKYKMKVNEQVYQGTTAPDGLIEHEIPANATLVKLTTWIKNPDDNSEKEQRWQLKLGNLDPQTTVTGIQARLNNLGYRCGPVDGVVGRRTKHALQKFQEKNSLEVTGTITNETRNLLDKLHGS